MSINSKLLSIFEKLNTINKLDGVLNVPRTRITDMGILVRKVTGKMPDRYQYVLKTAENYTSSEHICSKVSRTFQSFPFKSLFFLVRQIFRAFSKPF
jgi:hypothetical protein